MINVKMIAAGSLSLMLLAACGGESFQGNYTAAGGMQEFNFKEDGHMVQSMAGNKIAEFKFEKEGDEIKVIMNENASQIYTVQASGELIGPGGIKLTKKVNFNN
ncbi:hypothetical protein K1M91_19625 [Motilimonas sp. E26]|nr:hypothetical protein [Motilimonas sp. E26]